MSDYQTARLLNSSRTLLAVVAGCLSGYAGLENTVGLVPFVACLLLSALIVRTRVASVSWWDALSLSFFSSLFSFLLFWVLFFNLFN